MKLSNRFSMKPVAMAMLLAPAILTMTACGGGSGGGDVPPPVEPPVETPPAGADDNVNLPTFSVLQGNDANRLSSPLLSFNPGGPGGSPNQSLRAGDVLQAGADADTVLIGGLGVDVLVGDNGRDILIGGTEDFNSNVDGDDLGADNRDRAFGNEGEDVFIWTPGDGSDFFEGGDGEDVLILGLLGENQDNDGSTEGAPFFNVSPPGREGSQDFDGIFLDEFNQPIVDVTNSPGFCSVVAAADQPDVFEALNLDHLVRFTLRGVANDFDQGLRSDDDGLRVAISVKDVEYLVCAERDTTSGTAISVLDLTVNPPMPVDLAQLPDFVARMIQ